MGQQCKHMQKNGVGPSASWHIQALTQQKSLKLLEENTVVKLCDFELGNGVLGITVKTQVTKRLNFIKLKKNFVLQRNYQ